MLASIDCASAFPRRALRRESRFLPKYEGKTPHRVFAIEFVPLDDSLRPGSLPLGAGVVILVGLSIACKVFTSYSHPRGLLSASGLRLETRLRSDKKISELYFAAIFKKILTLNLNRQVDSNVASDRLRMRLTAPRQSRNFIAQNRRKELSGAVVMPQNSASFAKSQSRNFNLRWFQRAAAVCFFATMLLPLCGAAAPSRGRITHVVIFWLKRPENVADRAALVRASASFREMPGILSVEIGHALPVRRPGIEQHFDLSVVFTFQDQAALRRFERDPRHAAAIASVLKPLVKRYVVFNSVAD